MIDNDAPHPVERSQHDNDSCDSVNMRTTRCLVCCRCPAPYVCYVCKDNYCRDDILFRGQNTICDECDFESRNPRSGTLAVNCGCSPSHLGAARRFAKPQCVSPMSKNHIIRVNKPSSVVPEKHCFHLVPYKEKKHVQFCPSVQVIFPDRGVLPDCCPVGTELSRNWMNGVREVESLREGKLANYIVLPPESYFIHLPPIRIVTKLTSCLNRGEINTLAQALAHLQAYVLNRQMVVEWVKRNVDVSTSIADGKVSYEDIVNNKSILRSLPKYFAASPLPVARTGRVSFKFHRALAHPKFDDLFMYGYLTRSADKLCTISILKDHDESDDESPTFADEKEVAALARNAGSVSGLCVERPAFIEPDLSGEARPSRLRPKRGETGIPIFDFLMYGSKPPVILIDSGATYDTLSEASASQTVSWFSRRLDKPIDFDTCGGPYTSTHGAKCHIAPWDMVSEFVFMDSPDLISMGQRCLFGGFTFVWVESKLPCFISYGGRYVIVFDIDGVIPSYDPECETKDDLLGTFEASLNCFLDQCGIFINDQGRFCLDLPIQANFRPVDGTCKYACASTVACAGACGVSHVQTRT